MCQITAPPRLRVPESCAGSSLKNYFGLDEKVTSGKAVVLRGVAVNLSSGPWRAALPFPHCEVLLHKYLSLAVTSFDTVLFSTDASSPDSFLFALVGMNPCTSGISFLLRSTLYNHEGQRLPNGCCVIRYSLAQKIVQVQLCIWEGVRAQRF